MSSCPECRKILLGSKEKCSCGWKAPRQSRQSTGRCEFVGCLNAGTLSHNTFSKGGWLCSFHFFGAKKKAKNPDGRSFKEILDNVKVSSAEAQQERAAIQQE